MAKEYSGAHLMRGYYKTRGVGRKGRGGIVGKYELKLESPEEWYTCVCTWEEGWVQTTCN